jgi:hypothetical protein
VLRLMTATKVAALAAVAVAAAVVAEKSATNLDPVFLPPSTGAGLGALALAFTSVVWTYEGWSDGPTIAGETRRPDRDVPRALLLGTRPSPPSISRQPLLPARPGVASGPPTPWRYPLRPRLRWRRSRVRHRPGAGLTWPMLGMIIAAPGCSSPWVTACSSSGGPGPPALPYPRGGGGRARLRSTPPRPSRRSSATSLRGRYLFLLNVGSVVIHRRRRPEALRPSVPFTLPSSSIS